MLEPECSRHKSRVPWAGACLAQRCFQRSPQRSAGRGIWPWQVHLGGGDGSFSFIPPACRFPFSDAKAMVLAGRSGAAPAWGNAAFVWVSPAQGNLSALVLPAAPGWQVTGVGDIAQPPQCCRVVSGRGWTGAAAVPAQPQRCRVGPACPCCSSPGLAPGTVFLSPLLNGFTDPTSNPGRCLRSRRSSCPPDNLCLGWGQPWEKHQWLLPPKQSSLTQQFDIQREQGCVCVCVHAYVWCFGKPRIPRLQEAGGIPPEMGRDLAKV